MVELELDIELVLEDGDEDELDLDSVIVSADEALGLEWPERIEALGGILLVEEVV